MSKYQKTAIISVLFICIIAAIRIIDNNIIYNGSKFVEAFNTTSFEIKESQLNIWGEYIPKYMTMDDMINMGQKIANEIGIDDYEENSEDNELKKIYTIEKKSVDASTKIQITETIELLENGIYKPKNYISVNLTLYNKCSSIGYFEKNLTKVFERLMINPVKGIIITAAREGRVSELAAREIMEDLIRLLGGEVREIIIDNNLKTAYGYSGHMKDYVISKGDKINMDLAITYNEIEEKTYLYAGIPVITFEY